MVGTPFITINTFLTNFTALKQPYLIFEIFNTYEYQKLDRHLQAGLPVSILFYVNLLFKKYLAILPLGFLTLG